MSNAERCICCGEIIPEGRYVCPNCMVGVGRENKKHKKKMHRKMAKISRRKNRGG